MASVFLLLVLAFVVSVYFLLPSMRKIKEMKEKQGRSGAKVGGKRKWLQEQ